jgi:hypothetical protein
MKMRDILAEWKNFTKSKAILKEGGNATAYEIDPETGKGTPVFWKGKTAQANPIVFDKNITREVFVEDSKELVKVIDELHKSKFGEGIFFDSARDEILNSGYAYMGSSEFLYSPVISSEDYNRFKKKTGDIDLLIPDSKIESLWNLLNLIKGKKLTDNITFVGHNKLTVASIRGEQINAIFEFDYNGRQFLFQIDFVFVPYDEQGRPKEEEKFLRGSTWEDITAGIKGIGHKQLLQALGSKVKVIPYRSAYIATGASTAQKPRLQVKLPDIKNIRTGSTPITIQDLQELIPALAKPDLFKKMSEKITREEVERFSNAALKNPSLENFLDEILNPEGVAQNQNITFLITYLVHAPTVKSFDLQEYFDTFTSIMTFSMGRGLSPAYEIEPYQLSGKPVYKYKKFEERKEKYRKAEDVFRAIFGAEPTIQDVRDAASFLGLLRIMKKYLDDAATIRAYEGLVYYFYQDDSYMSIHDVNDDLEPKKTILDAFERDLPVVQNSKKYKDKEAIVALHVEKYLEHLAKIKDNLDAGV